MARWREMIMIEFPGAMMLMMKFSSTQKRRRDDKTGIPSSNIRVRAQQFIYLPSNYFYIRRGDLRPGPPD
jgi:hypothetical protein